VIACSELTEKDIHI